jgi:hypothetical protein
MLRRFESLPGISVKPELPKRKALGDQFNAVLEYAETYDLTVWVVDLDVVIKEDALNEFKQYLLEAEPNERIRVLVNAPCLEFWFLQHVKDSGAYFATCDPAGKELKKYDPLKNYEKSQGYYTNFRLDIYKRLHPLLKTAVANAKKRGEFNIDEPETGKAELYKLFELLGITV